MRAFCLLRTEDESGISGVGRIAEGIEFSNGLCAVTWLSDHPSVNIYMSLNEIEVIHGHHGKTQIVFEST